MSGDASAAIPGMPDESDGDVVGWMVVVHEQGRWFGWDGRLHVERPLALAVLQAASNDGAFCKLAEVRLVASGSGSTGARA